MNNKKKITGIYPGTFDPFTYGHLDIVIRATHIVEKLIISVAENKNKTPIFTLKERISIINESLTEVEKKDCEILVVGFDDLLVEHAKRSKAQVIIRGLRAVADFEYEFQMAGMNAKLCPDIETIFLMASENLQLTSARFVKEVAFYKGNIEPFVPKNVIEKLNKKLKRKEDNEKL
tara:strand:- start:968 stop:1495 length:528 start_codon:yes stop_codon:yes gene_type:complete